MNHECAWFRFNFFDFSIGFRFQVIVVMGGGESGLVVLWWVVWNDDVVFCHLFHAQMSTFTFVSVAEQYATVSSFIHSSSWKVETALFVMPYMSYDTTNQPELLY